MLPSRVSFRHLIRLTDDTGILEHSLGRIPRRKEGYSTDDQARALWACLEWLDLVDGPETEALHRLVDVYLSFLLWVQRDDGHFHNNIAFDRTKEDELPSDDCLGRCLWACAKSTVMLEDAERRMAAKAIFENALPLVGSMQYPRGWSYALAALGFMARHDHTAKYEAEMDMLAARLLAMYRKNRKPDWHWYEPVITYSNGVIPWGLLCAYESMKQKEILQAAKESLDFLITLSVNEKGQIRPIGNRGWCSPDYRAQWDQQPVDVMKLALAASKAFEVIGDEAYAEIVEKCRFWFYGQNDAGITMMDEKEGSCYDGLSERGANLNQGAESTIAFLLTEALYRKLFKTKGEM